MMTPVGPTGVQIFTGWRQSGASSANQFAVAAALDTYVAGGGALTLAFLISLEPVAVRAGERPDAAFR